MHIISKIICGSDNYVTILVFKQSFTKLMNPLTVIIKKEIMGLD